MDNSIIVEGLKKSYGPIKVLKGLNFAVRRGSVLGILGPNGAGKTTTVRILSTLLKPDGGRVLVNGYDVVREPDKVRSSIGLTGQYAAVDEYLTGLENLEMMGRLYRLSDADTKRRAEGPARTVRPRGSVFPPPEDIFGRHAEEARSRG